MPAFGMDDGSDVVAEASVARKREQIPLLHIVLDGCGTSKH